MINSWQRKFSAFAALAGVALISGNAQAQCTPAATTNGPDVIVGDLTGPTNYSSNGALEALSIGTTSCNLGNTALGWHANNNQHPVIGGNLYRYKIVNGAGHFEQVGLSWLKHGFFAESEGLCCTGCQADTSGATLGVHCSDPYTSSRNGGQSPLGPRWQVNANTGAFTYPPAGGTGFSGSTARRLEVLISDCEVTSGSTTRYFGEAHYVTPDDAANRNQNNNASWREVTVTGSGTAFTFAFTGSTVRTQYALNAWKVADPTATLNEVQLPGEGLIIVGFKTTNLGGGIYHYEYAVQNLNSDTSIGGFSLPVGAANITNIGFHGVTYRNGDGIGNVNRDNTDWVGTVSGGVISWATAQDSTTNPNGNAIRWSSTYNFRFDADQAPVSGLVTLATFKTVGTATTTVDVPGGPAPSFAFCFGDGSGTACPCGNNSIPGNHEGCLNSLGSGGKLTVTGSASVSADTLVLLGDGMPDSSALYYQGTTQVAGGAGANFGDGNRCAGGSVIRLGTKTNFLAGSQYPDVGDTSVSVHGAVSVGDTRTYQIWYRNAANFCTASTYNVSNGYQLVWQP